MKKYTKDYEPDSDQPAETKSGMKYRYVGKYYHLELDSGEKKKIIVKNFAFCGVIFCLFFTGLLLNNPGSRIFFIMIPYEFLFLFFVYSVIGSYDCVRLSPKMERACYDRSLGRLRRSSTGTAVLSLYVVLADIVFIVRISGAEIPMKEIVFLCINILIFFTGALQRRYLGRLAARVKIEGSDAPTAAK